MKDTPVNLCFACNDKYAPHMAAAIASILEHFPSGRKLFIYVLTSNISTRNKSKICELKKFRNFSISFIDVNKDDFSECPITGYVKYITKETYYRFKIPALLNNVDKVLYLDCDIVALADISPLFDYELPDGKYIGMVPDTDVWWHQERLNFPKTQLYCNAGVMLMDNKKLREIGATKILFDYTKSPDREIQFQDQDVLNIVFGNKIEYLPIYWNVMHNVLNKTGVYSGKYEIQCMDVLRKGKIVHFTHPKKPWNFGCTNVYREQYCKFLKETPYRALFFKIQIFKKMERLLSYVYSKKKQKYTKIIKIFGIKIKWTNKWAHILNDVSILRGQLDVLDQRSWYIHECVKSIFQYQTGLQFDDDCRPERMIVFDPQKAPIDHRKRYEFALSNISPSDVILDAACGVGYGTFLLASKCKSATGLDISTPSIAFAKRIFNAANLNFDVANLLELDDSKYPRFDAIVSFETIEHVPNHKLVIKTFRKMLKTGGKLICSVPNQNVVPFTKETHPFHVRHFTPEQITEDLKQNSFGKIEIYYQYVNEDFNIDKSNIEGEDIIIIAEAI